MRRWLGLLKENSFAIAPRYWPRAASISLLSVVNSVMVWRGRRHAERASYDTRRHAERACYDGPLFIIGHWRSGTSHLHHLLAADERFISPSVFQVLFPRSFGTAGRILPRLLKRSLPPTRGVDGMPLAADGPGEEDERALSILCGKSPYLGVTFPRAEMHYDRYLTFRAVPQAERTEWQGALTAFVERFAGDSGRMPLLKSPPHTCRIRLLLEAFHNARFVHIHRHPFEVFQSMRRLMTEWRARHSLQRYDGARDDERIIRQYKEMYDVFFEERSAIPTGRFVEVAFEDLQRNPLAELRRVYRELTLADFELAGPAVRRYLESVAGHERNVYPELPHADRERLFFEWRRTFEEWGYERE